MGLVGLLVLLALLHAAVSAQQRRRALRALQHAARTLAVLLLRQHEGAGAAATVASAREHAAVSANDSAAAAAPLPPRALLQAGVSAARLQLSTSPASGAPTRGCALLEEAQSPDTDGGGAGGSSPGVGAAGKQCGGGSCCAVLRGHGAWVTATAWLPCGALLTAASDGCVRLWEAAQLGCADQAAPSRVLEGHAGAVRALCPLPSCPCPPGSPACGRAFASAGDDGTLRTWALDAGAQGEGAPGVCTSVVSAHGDAVFALLALPNATLLSCSADASCRAWRGARCVALLRGHGDYVLAAVRVQGEGEGEGKERQCLVATGSWDATLRIWDLSSTAAACAGDDAGPSEPAEPVCCRVLRGHRGGVRALAPLPRFRLASGGADGQLRVWQALTGCCERALPRCSREAGAVLALAPLPWGRVAAAHEDGLVRVWSAARAQAQPLFLRGHSKKVYALDARWGGHGGATLASASRDHTARLWTIEAEQEEP